MVNEQSKSNLGHFNASSHTPSRSPFTLFRGIAMLS